MENSMIILQNRAFWVALASVVLCTLVLNFQG